jgi:DUF1365 family protein
MTAQCLRIPKTPTIIHDRFVPLKHILLYMTAQCLCTLNHKLLYMTTHCRCTPKTHTSIYDRSLSL